VRDLLAATGFTELAWEDFTDAELERRRELAAAPGGVAAPPNVGHLLQGADWPEIQQNMTRNYAEDRLRLIQVGPCAS
jgi:hypothetical protein